MPSRPATIVAACAPLSMPCPPASTPISSTSSVADERVEDADRVRAAADAGDDGVREAADLLEHLRARFAADHRLQIAHDHRIGVHAGGRAEDVEGRCRRW